MISFIFSVLGSVVFWILFFIVGFFVGSILLKYLAPETFNYYILGKKRNYESPPEVMFFIIIGNFLLWPIVLAFTIIIYSLKFIIGKILWPLFCSGVKKSVSIIPDIEIKKKNNET